VSHAPADARHSSPAERTPSPGQTFVVPVQVSAVSHPPAAARQIVPGGLSTSPGHSAALPVHASAKSHAPLADALHVNVVS